MNEVVKQKSRVRAWMNLRSIANLKREVHQITYISGTVSVCILNSADKNTASKTAIERKKNSKKIVDKNHAKPSKPI